MLHSRSLWIILIVVLCGWLTGSVLAEEPKPTPKKDGGATDNPFLARVLARFDAWDKNKAGFLDKEELTEALGATRASAALERYGKEGKISREQYEAWARNYVQELIKAQQAQQREGRPRRPG